MRTIFVTGAGGYIGSHTSLLLLNMGLKVYALDSYVNSYDISLKNLINISNENKENFHFYKGDIRDKNILRDIFSQAKKNGNPIESVIHFAGLKSVSESIKKPLEYWDNNVNGSINLLNVMNENNCYKIVFSSSAAIYSKVLENKIDENSPISPTNPYGKTKYVIEQILNDIFNSSDNKWRIANLRYFNPIGAHESGILGENPKGIPNNIFPLITRVAAGIIKEIEIFGNDWPTTDGTGVRDYIHVMDLAEGHIKALEYLFSAKPQIININLGTGVGTSVLELIKIFQKVNNISIPYVFRTRRPGDRAIVIADNSLAKKKLNWVPKRSLEKMCKSGWRWQEKNNIIFDN